MSVRNRPRNPIVKDDMTEELNLWRDVVVNIKKCQSINDKYEELAGRIPDAETAIPDEEPSEALKALDVLSNLQRECLKQSEQELAILSEEQTGLIANLDSLIEVRTAFEAESPAPRERHSSKDSIISKTGRNVKRKHEAVASEMTAESPRSTPAPEPVVSVPAPSKAMAAAAGPIPKKANRSASGSTPAGSTQSDSTVEADQVIKSTPSSISGGGSSVATSTKFAVDSEVFFRHRLKSNSEGEGIICTITNILEPSGPSKPKRYEIQDTEPDEDGKIPPPVKALASELVSIPANNNGLPQLKAGKQVIARYPHTNTFYKAEVVRTAGKVEKKDACRLRFEAEEDEKMEKEVERRYVFDLK